MSRALIISPLQAFVCTAGSRDDQGNAMNIEPGHVCVHACVRGRAQLCVFVSVTSSLGGYMSNIVHGTRRGIKYT